jgi:hypothetical protein
MLIAVLVGVNLVAQAVLATLVLRAVRLARKRKLRTHCRAVSVAALGQIAAAAAIMTPALIGFIGSPPSQRWFAVEIAVHHSAGLLVLLFWVYVTLAFRSRLPVPTKHLRLLMRTAAVLWTLALTLGLHMFVYIWLLHGAGRS